MIFIEIIGVKWEPGKESISFASRAEKLRFEDWMAREFIRLVKLSVDLQRYRAKWSPLSLAYLNYKRDAGLSLKTWEATGELIGALKYKESSRRIGFDNRVRHKDSNEKYLEIARKLEYGNLKIPPRPLFRPVYLYMRKNTEFFKDKYRREVGM